MDNIKRYDVQEGTTMGWHKKTRINELLELATCWLSTWNVIPVEMQKRGQPSKWRILEASDVPGLEIGAPYNPGSFQPIDNPAFLKMVQDSISGTPHKVVSAGSIRNRGRVFISIELAGMEKFKAAGREFSAFLNFGNGHDKSSVLWVNTSNTCTVCDNTFSANLYSVENKAKGNGNGADVGDDLSVLKRHTKNVLLKLPAIATLVDKAIGVQAEFALEFDKLSQIEIAPATATGLFAGFIGRDIPLADKAEDQKGLHTRGVNKVNRLVELFADAKQGNNGRNLADAFSAVTDYYSHESAGGTENRDRQVLSSEYGSGLENKREFWTMVRNGEERHNTIEKGLVLLKAS